MVAFGSSSSSIMIEMRLLEGLVDLEEVVPVVWVGGEANGSESFELVDSAEDARALRLLEAEGRGSLEGLVFIFRSGGIVNTKDVRFW